MILRHTFFGPDSSYTWQVLLVKCSANIQLKPRTLMFTPTHPPFLFLEVLIPTCNQFVLFFKFFCLVYFGLPLYEYTLSSGLTSWKSGESIIPKLIAWFVLHLCVFCGMVLIRQKNPTLRGRKAWKIVQSENYQPRKEGVNRRLQSAKLCIS